jgi:hypothetical protein
MGRGRLNWPLLLVLWLVVVVLVLMLVLMVMGIVGVGMLLGGKGKRLLIILPSCGTVPDSAEG